MYHVAPWLPARASGKVTASSALRLIAYYSDTFVLPLPDTHRFPMRKYSALRTRLLDEGVLTPDNVRLAPAAEWDDLGLVHTRAYLDAVATGTLAPALQRRIGFPWSPGMVERARRSVGATIAAAHTALQYGVSANLAGGTHHAFADHGGGFCVFNDVAVATRLLMRDGLVGHVVVIDCDVHQGDGTANIFRDDASVFTLSLHATHNYPFHKEVSDLDIAFDDGAGDSEYMSALAAHVPAVLDRERPDLAFYLAGADPYEGDRLGRLKLTVDGLRERDRLVFAWCRERDVRVAVSMSGGYAANIDDIVHIHSNTIREAVRSRTSWS